MKGEDCMAVASVEVRKGYTSQPDLVRIGAEAICPRAGRFSGSSFTVRIRNRSEGIALVPKGTTQVSRLSMTGGDFREDPVQPEQDGSYSLVGGHYYVRGAGEEASYVVIPSCLKPYALSPDLSSLPQRAARIFGAATDHLALYRSKLTSALPATLRSVLR